MSRTMTGHRAGPPRSALRAAVVLVGCLAAASSFAGGPHEFFVAPGGDDANPGTREKPFATLQHARDAIRRAKHDAGITGGVTVWLQGGVYRLSETFELGSEDSGTRSAPIAYRAMPGKGVALTGGVELKPADFEAVTDPDVRRHLSSDEARRHVLRIGLGAYGVADLPEIRPRGFPQPTRPAPVELFFNDEPMTLARWPNAGFAKTGRVIDPGSRSRSDDKDKRLPCFIYDGDRPNRWRDADEVWLVGYWQYDWADESMRVKSIDPAKHEITLASPHCYGVAAGKPFYAENLLEELDRPGEYYIDRENRTLYFWPPGPIDAARVSLSLLGTPLISMRDVSNVTIRGVTLELARGDGIRIEGGGGVRVAGCTLRNLGNRAVVVEGGRSHVIVSCDIYQTGEGGIVLSGGDRRALTPADHAAVNNDIHDFSRRVATYRPGIRISGVACRAANNAIHDAPHSAIIFWGNDHVIEFNEIYNVLSRTGDGGAVYTGRDWTFRGNVIRYNFFHDIRGIDKWENAVYIDDQASGMTIYGNIFRNCHWGMLIGGGRDNLIENNVFSNCRLAVHLDARGLGWGKDRLGPTLRKRLDAMPYQAEPWASRYPKLVGILDDEPMTPKGNVLRNNVLHASGKIDADIAAAARKHAIIKDNAVFSQDPGFVDVTNGVLQFSDSSEVWRVLPGFKRIPVERIGLYADEDRRSVGERSSRP